MFGFLPLIIEIEAELCHEFGCPFLFEQPQCDGKCMFRRGEWIDFVAALNGSEGYVGSINKRSIH